jgi:hypothetical protein
MAISNTLLAKWIRRISSVQGIEMDADALVDDILLMAYAFENEDTFNTAMTHVVSALLLIVKQRNVGQDLKANLTGWKSYHFQSQRIRKHPADLRIVYQDTGSAIRVRGFGHRWIPEEVYKRLYKR